jgi:histidinol dehydrogenase
MGGRGKARARPLMPVRLDSRDAGFARDFETLLNSKREASEEVGTAVAAILTEVKARGDEAVVEYTNRFDKLALTPETLAFTADEIAAARSRISADVLAALTVAHSRITAHHEKQRPVDHVYQDHLGVTLGTIWTPVGAVGLYVPGGLPPIRLRC